MRKILVILLLTLLVILQYQLWLSPNGFAKSLRIKQAIAQQKNKNEVLEKHNATIKADISALKQGQSVEEHARSDIGMIKKGEVFFQVVK
jgi:cell division protein FtsB